MKFTSIFAAAALALCIGAAAPALASTGLTSVTDPVFHAPELPLSLGWGFTTTGESINALGYNATRSSGDHDVGIYDSNFDLLASVTVTNASTLNGLYRYENLASTLTLGAGTYYIVGTTMFDPWISNAASFTTNAETTYIGSFYSNILTTVLQFPVYPAESDDAFLNVNFDTNLVAAGAPEPAAWAMMLVGFAGVGYAVRRRRRGALAAV